MADKYAKLQPKVPKITIAIILGIFLLTIGALLLFTPDNQKVIYESYQPYATEHFKIGRAHV